MKLHGTTGKPDWASIRKRRYNVWQRLAAATKGVATPGNVVTLAGFAVVVIGLIAILQHHYLLGALLLVIGRLSDVLDGWLADRTATKSPLGESLDAGVDKLGTLLTIVVFFAAHLAPAWLLVGLVLPHVVILLIVLGAARQNRRIHPSATGKISMALAWVGLLGLVAVRAAAVSHGSFVWLAAQALCLVSSALGFYTAVGRRNY